MHFQFSLLAATVGLTLALSGTAQAAPNSHSTKTSATGPHLSSTGTPHPSFKGRLGPSISSGKFGPAAANQTTYFITGLAPLQNYLSTSARNLNDRGQVVGVVSADGAGYRQAFVTTTSGTLTLIPALSGDPSNEARGISASGQVVGWSGPLSGMDNSHAFITDVNGANPVRINFPVSATSNLPYEINASGQVAGTFYFYRGGAEGFLTGANGVGVQEIPVPPGETTIAAYAVNDAGQVTGLSYRDVVNQINITTAYLRSADGSTLRSLGTLPGDLASIGYDVNGSGQVVGSSQGSNGLLHAFMTQAGGDNMSALGVLPGDSQSIARGINDTGLVVGYSRSSNSSNSHAFVTDGTTMVDLNTVTSNGAGWILTDAVAINNRGQIAGTGFYNGSKNAFLLTPQAQDVSSQVQVKRGGFRFNRTDNTFVQQVTVTNRSGNAIVGPVSLVFDNLVGTLVSQSAATKYTSPAGSPAFTVSTGTMAAGSSLSVTLQFRQSGSEGITYTTRILDGQGFL